MSGHRADSATARSGVRDRLPRIAPALAPRLRALFRVRREREVTYGQVTSYWHLLPARNAAREWVELAGARHTVWLAVAEDGWCDEIGPRAWWDYAGKPRLLAWGLAHETLLTHLGQWMGGDTPQPIGFRDRIMDNGRDLQLDWRAVTGNGPGAAGGILIPAALLEEIIADEAWRTRDTAAAPWKHIPARTRVELHTLVFPLAELRAFEPDDIMLIADAARAWSSMTLSVTRDMSWPVAYDNGRLTIRGAISRSLPRQEDAMNSTDTDTSSTPENSEDDLVASEDNAATPEQQPEGDLNDIPVTVSFDLGRLDVNLGELAALQPGYVFDLPRPLENAPVTVRANGRTIGRGELILVGENLGVRLLRFKADGLR